MAVHASASSPRPRSKLLFFGTVEGDASGTACVLFKEQCHITSIRIVPKDVRAFDNQGIATATG
jgi:hypothetical protein